MVVLGKIGNVENIVSTMEVAHRTRENKEFGKFVIIALTRFTQGDWGDLDKADIKANENALKTGERILGSYTDTDGESLWIIADATDDNGCRQAVTILFPHEY